MPICIPILFVMPQPLKCIGQLNNSTNIIIRITITMCTITILNCILLSYFVHSVLSASASPSWAANTLLNSGEHKAIFQTTGVQLAPSTFTVNQTFNASFASAPRVILCMEGFRQNQPTCVGCQIGFKYVINTITGIGFNSSLTIYGSNMTFLFYMYLGISTTATQYFPSSNILTFTGNNLTDILAPSRIHTQIFTNPTGESYPNFATNTITNLIYLAGFKMSYGNTGLYINLTSNILSANTHSITIATKADVQVFQICYYRLGFDKTAIMNGMQSVIDLFGFQGINNVQQTTVVVVDPTPLMYRNYLMGFNHLNIANPNQPVDIMLQFYMTPQTIFKSSSTMLSFINATFQYVWADVFQHRRRTCAVSTPYFYYNTLLCYDVCPVRLYGVNSTMYCQKCHFSCQMCAGGAAVQCSSCDGVGDKRGYSNGTGQCLCLDGYYQVNVSVCAACAPQCQTCTSSPTYCLSCHSSQFRTYSPVSHSCPCSPSYYQSSVYSPLTCLSCNPACLTCQVTSTNCTSCLGTNNRQHNSMTNVCQCVFGYYQVSYGNPVVCLLCDSTCVGCTGSAGVCVGCDVGHNRGFNGNNSRCQCMNGYYQTSVNTPVTCLACNPACLTCMGSATVCTTCDSAHNRSYNSNNSRCQCISGYYQTALNVPVVCLLCDSVCVGCTGSPTNCLACVTGYYLDTINNTGCIPCSSSITGCLQCNTQPTSQLPTCTLCNTTQLYTLSSPPLPQSCQCPLTHYSSPSSGCLACNYQCSSCIDSLSCATCDSVNNHRQLNSNVSLYCPCVVGYWDDGVGAVCLGCHGSCVSCVGGLSTQCLTCDNSRYHSNVGSTGSCVCNPGTTQSPNLQCTSSTTTTCGNSILQPTAQQCDDGNTASSDGCSSQCRIQQNHNCQLKVNSTQSICYYNKPMNMSISSVIKVLGSNQVNVVLLMQAMLCNMDKLKVYLEGITALVLSTAARRVLATQTSTSRVLSTGTSRVLATSTSRVLANQDILYIQSSRFTITDASQYTGQLSLSLSYTESIPTLQSRTIHFLSSSSLSTHPYFFLTPSSSISLQDPYNKIPMTYLQPSSYSLSTSLSYIFLVLFIMHYLFFVISVFFKRGAIGVECCLVASVVYFCSYGLKAVGVGMFGVGMHGRYVYGVNVGYHRAIMSNGAEFQMCKNMGILYQQCNTINNINITYYISILALIFYLLCQCYRTRQQKLLSQTPQPQPQTQSQQATPPQLTPEPSPQSSTPYQTSSSQQPLILTYNLPKKIQSICTICLQYCIGMCILTTVQLVLNIINQNQTMKIASIVWMGVIGLSFVGLWGLWFVMYPVDGLSYCAILNRRLEKVSVEKFVYFGLWVGIMLWGIVLAVAPAIAAYSIIIVYSIIWIFLATRKLIYKSKYHKLRSTLTQLVIIMIAATYIIMYFIENDGIGLPYTFALMALLAINLVINVVLFGYEYHTTRKNEQLSADIDKFKQIEGSQLKAYSSLKPSQIGNQIQRTQAKQAQYEQISQRRQPLISQIGIVNIDQIKQQIVKNKLTQLKTLRKQLKISNEGLADQQKVQILSSIRKMDHREASLQQSSFRDL